MQYNNIRHIEATRAGPVGGYDTAYGIIVGKTAAAICRTVRAYFLTI